jgi:hypothetical protein
MSRNRSLLVLVAMAFSLSASGAARADVIAYDNAAVANNQAFGGTLGLAFDINKPVVVSQLGAFDMDSSGHVALKGVDGTSGITVFIVNRDTGLQFGPSVTFSPSNPGHQINGDAFLPISLLTLPAGFHGEIVAQNDPNYNTGGGANASSTLNTANGAISFVYIPPPTPPATTPLPVGPRYNGGFVVYPGNLDGGPANRYDAGTFMVTPEPSSCLLSALGLVGLVATWLKRRK